MFGKYLVKLNTALSWLLVLVVSARARWLPLLLPLVYLTADV